MTDKRKRGAPLKGTHVIWRAGLRERWGVSAPTLWRWERKGKVPPPDVRIGDREGWKPETIERIEQSA